MRGVAQGLALLLAALAVAGCASIGPATVPRDRADYMTAVANSWKQQTLMNVVRMRYGDAPTFVDVSSVIASYTLQGQITATGELNSLGAKTPPDAAVISGGAAYVDRPTITYTPLSGDRFARSLLRPIPPSAIFELIQAGFPADRMLQMSTRAINGVYNRSSLGKATREADPEFYPLLDALRALQLSGAVTIRMEKRGDDQVGLLILSRKDATANPDYQYILKVLGIRSDPGGEISLTFGLLPRNDREVAVLTRSMLAILLELANGVEAPAADVAAGRTPPAGRVADAPDPHDRPLVRILSGPSAPADAYTAVRYRGVWFWIPDDDLSSKNMFSFLMMFFSLAETGVQQSAPVITVPAN
jgi:hypothetical protein